MEAQVAQAGLKHLCIKDRPWILDSPSLPSQCQEYQYYQIATFQFLLKSFAHPDQIFIEHSLWAWSQHAQNNKLCSPLWAWPQTSELSLLTPPKALFHYVGLWERTVGVVMITGASFRVLCTLNLSNFISAKSVRLEYHPLIYPPLIITGIIRKRQSWPDSTNIRIPKLQHLHCTEAMGIFIHLV